LAKGELDFVMLGRPLIADPEIPNKLREGREDDIRLCLRCNEYCFGNLMKGLRVTCAVNAVAGYENEYQIVRSATPLTAAVIGGGPAGMEAARVAALRGHSVTLYSTPRSMSTPLSWRAPTGSSQLSERRPSSRASTART